MPETSPGFSGFSRRSTSLPAIMSAVRNFIGGLPADQAEVLE
jgi:hypothetical protein